MGQSDKERHNTGKNKTRQDRTKQKRVLTRERTRTFEGRRQIENAVNKRGRDETRKKQERTGQSDKERNTTRKCEIKAKITRQFKTERDETKKQGAARERTRQKLNTSRERTTRHRKEQDTTRNKTKQEGMENWGKERDKL